MLKRFSLTCLVIFMLALFSSQCHAVMFVEAQEVYQKLIKDNHLKNPPKLVYLFTNVINAYSTGKEVQITQGMLFVLRSKDEVAVVLGHELGHYYLKHKTSTPSNEYAADKLGAVFMRKTGFNVCYGAKYLKRRNDPTSSSHPADKDRYKALGCQ